MMSFATAPLCPPNAQPCSVVAPRCVPTPPPRGEGVIHFEVFSLRSGVCAFWYILVGFLVHFGDCSIITSRRGGMEGIGGRGA